MKRFKVTNILWIVFLIIFAGCGVEILQQGEPTDMTSQGYWVNIPDSIYEHGIYLSDHIITDHEEIRQTLLTWVDARVEEWMISHPEIDRDRLNQIAHSQIFALIDHCVFPCGQSSDPTEADGYHGLCNGTNNNEGTIRVAIYYLSRSDAPILNLNSPPYLIFTSDEIVSLTNDDYWSQWTYLQCYIPAIWGIGMSSIPHELNHSLNRS